MGALVSARVNTLVIVQVVTLVSKSSMKCSVKYFGKSLARRPDQHLFSAQISAQVSTLASAQVNVLLNDSD